MGLECMLMIFEDYDDSRFVSMVKSYYERYDITVIGSGGTDRLQVYMKSV